MPDEFGNPYPWEAPIAPSQAPPMFGGAPVRAAQPWEGSDAGPPPAPPWQPPGASMLPPVPVQDQPWFGAPQQGSPYARLMQPGPSLSLQAYAPTPSRGFDPLSGTTRVQVGGAQAEEVAAPVARPALPSDPLSRLSPEQQAKLAGTMVQVGGGGGGVRTSTLTKRTAQLPGYQDQLNQIGELGRSSILAQGEAQAERAKQEALAYRGNETALKARKDAWEAEELDQQARIIAQDARYTAVRSEVASMKVDPEKWTKSQSIGAQIGWALAAAVSGFAQGFTRQGGPNPALALIEDHITRDIDSQKANIAKKGAEATGERGILADLYARLGDMRQSELQARQMIMEGLGTKLRQISAATQEPIVRANAELLAGEFSQKIAQLKNASFALSAGEQTTSQTKVPGAAGQRIPMLELLRRSQIQGQTYSTTMAKLKQEETKAQTDTAALLAPAAPKEKAILEGAPVDVMRKVNIARDAIAQIRKETKDMWMGSRQFRGKIPANWGSTWKTRLDNKAALAGEAMAAVTGRTAGVETKALMARWDNGEDVLQRLTDAAGMLESQTKNYLETSAPKFNVDPFAKIEMRNRLRLQLLLKGKD